MKIKKYNPTGGPNQDGAWEQQYPEVNVDAIVTSNDPDTATGSTSGSFLRGDGSWSNELTGALKVGNVSGDNYSQIEHISDDFGFDFQHNNASSIQNLQGSTNQALVLGDVSKGNSATLLGASILGSGTWTKYLNLTGAGELYVGDGATSQVWHHDIFEPIVDNLDILPGYSNSNEDTISYNTTERAIELQSNTDNSMGLVYPALKTESGVSWKISFSIKASASATSGVYFRVQEYDGALPDGKTHISHDATHSAVQEDTRQRTNFYEDQAIGTDWEQHSFFYTPTSTTSWFSPNFLNWSGLGTNALYVKNFRIFAIQEDSADANTLDGFDSTQFLRSDTSDTMTGDLTLSKNNVNTSLTINSGTASSIINMNGTGTSFIEKDTGNDLYIAHNVSDKNIHFRVNDGGTQNVLMTLNGSSSRVGIGTGTSNPASLLHLTSGTSGDAVLTIEADTDNNNEADSPQIHLKQDGGATFNKVGIIGNANDVFTGSVANYSYMGGNNGLHLITNSVPKMTITTAGAVGIGETNPGNNLHIKNSNAATLRLEATDGGSSPATTSILQLYGFEGRGAGIKIRDSVNSASGASNREWFIGSGYASSRFNIGYASDGSQSSYLAQSKLTIENGGNVGIGTTTPNKKLTVAAEDGTVLVVHRPNNTNFDPHGIGFSTRGSDALNNNSDIRSGIFSDYNGDIFLSANTSGDISSDPLGSAALFVEGGNKNVGIGTTSPHEKLTVGTANARSDLSIFRSGNNISSSTDVGRLTFDVDYDASAIVMSEIVSRSTPDSAFRGALDLKVKSTSGSILTGLTVFGTVSDGPRVGIGTADPDEKLQVAGNIKTSGNLIFDDDANNSDYLIDFQEHPDGTYGAYIRYDGSASNALEIGTRNAGTETESIFIDRNTADVTFRQDVTIQGDLTINGSYTQIDTNTSTTEQWLVTNDGTGPAAIINQKGQQPIIDIQDDSTSVFYIEDGGNVGIGVTDPDEKLEVSGNAHLDYSLIGRGFRATNRGELHLNATGTNDVSEMFFGYGDGYTENNIRWGISDRGTTTGKLVFYRGPALGGFSAAMTITDDDYVGIGTESPSYGLDVHEDGGQIRAYGTTAKVWAEASDGGQASLELKNTEGHLRFIADNDGFELYDQGNSAQRIAIAANGNITFNGGQQQLNANGNIVADGDLYINNDRDNVDANIYFGDQDSTTAHRLYFDTSSQVFRFSSPLIMDSGTEIDGISTFQGQGATSGAGTSNGFSAQTSVTGATTLNQNYTYVYRLTTIGTGTNSGATYVVDYNPDNTTWSGRAVALSGTTSNHPLLDVSSGSAVIYTNHSSAYNIRYSVKRYNLGDSDGTWDMLGELTQWQRVVDKLYYNDGDVGIGTSNPSTRMHIVEDTTATALTVSNTSSNGTVVKLTSTGDNRNLYLQTDHIYSNGNLYFGDNSYETIIRGSDVKIENEILHTKSSYDDPDGENFYRIKLQDQGGIHNDVGIGQSGSGNMGFNVTASSSLLFYNGTNGEIARINATGLGIGTTNPAEKLHIDGGSIYVVDDGGNPRVVLGDNLSSGGYGQIQWNSSTDVLQLGSSLDTDSLAIAEDGDVGIGTASPSDKLEVVGNVRANRFTDRTNTSYYLDPASTSILYNIDIQNASTFRNDASFANDGDGIEFYGDNAIKKVSGTGMVITTDSTRSFDTLLQLERGAGGTKYQVHHTGNLTFSLSGSTLTITTS